MANILIQCLNKKDAAPTISIGIAKGFAENNNNVYCVISNQIENLEDWLEDNRLHVTLVDTGNRKNFIKKSITFFGVTRKKIKKIYKNVKFDVSIQPFIHPWGGCINSVIKSKYKMGICHDPYPHTGESFLNKIFAYIGYRSINELIVLTKSFVNIVKEKYKKPVYYMKLGLLSNNFKKRQVQFLPNKRINFLFFGRIEKYKGIGVLIDAYKKIDTDTVSLTIAGNGDFSEYEKVAESCKNISIINRYIQESEIEDLFLNSNTVLVVPYLDATQSGVIPIAVDYGIPIIASETGGLREQLDEGNIGSFVKAGDVEGLAYTMESFIEDPEKYLEQKKKVLEYREQLDWKNITKELLDELIK